MNPLLQKIYCKQCNKSIAVTQHIFGNQEHLTHGLVGCGCMQYPVINGILLSVNGPILEKARGFVVHYPWLLRRFETIPLFIFALPTTGYFSSLLVIGFWFLVFLPFEWYVKLMVWLRIWQPEWAERILHPGKNEGDLVADKQFVPNANVLDIGCGLCDFELRHQNEMRMSESVGIDFDLFALYAAQRYRTTNINLWWANVNDTCWWFKQGIFDIGVCIDGFHYIQEKELLLKSVISVIKKSGWFLVTNIHLMNYFPNTNNFQYALLKRGYEDLFKTLRHASLPAKNPGVLHVRVYAE